MTTEERFTQPAIPRFDGHYDHWSMLMENFLQSNELWELVEPAGAPVLTDAQRKEMKLKDLKVKNYLFQAIDRTVLDTIPKKDTAKDIWDAMKKKFEVNARVKRSHLQALRREFETLEMRSGEKVTEYFSRVMTVANKMRIYGEDMQDVKVVEKILRSLTEKFNYVVCSIEESKDIDALTVDELQSSLIVHEQKFQRRSSKEQALSIPIARYAEEDFLLSLPRKLLLGLLTLFISVIAMMVVFCTTLFIVFDEGTKVPALLAIALTSIPVITFIWLSHLLLSRSA